MKIYHLSQRQNTGYDTYSDCVVIAESADDAKTIHPRNKPFIEGEKYSTGSYRDDWADTLSGITVIEIGVAHSDKKRGVVCASFHAG